MWRNSAKLFKTSVTTASELRIENRTSKNEAQKLPDALRHSADKSEIRLVIMHSDVNTYVKLPRLLRTQ
jgi:hypothetical protein